MIIAAAEIYSYKGIDSTTMQEVADKAKIGVASLYRYFPGKIDLAVATAIYLWEQTFLPLGEFISRGNTAWANINNYMNGFLVLFKEKPDFFRFIENFDNYISRQTVRPESLNAYEVLLSEQDNQMILILEKGQENLSIRSDIDVADYYSISTRTIMAFAQKLLLRGRILQSDNSDPEKDLKTLITILLENIKLIKD